MLPGSWEEDLRRTGVGRIAAVVDGETVAQMADAVWASLASRRGR